MAMQAMDANTGPFVVHQPTAPGPSQIQSPQVFIVTSPHSSPTPISKVIARTLLAMGCTQLILGILEIAFNIGGQVMWASISYYVGPGYWCGVPAFITGWVGIAAGIAKGKCAIITFLVMSIITCVLTTGIIVTSALSISVGKYLYPSGGYYYNYNTNSYNSLINASLAWNILMLIAGSIEFVIAIISSSIACNSLCGNPQHNTVTVLHSGQQPHPGGQAMAPVTTNPPPYQSQAPGMPSSTSKAEQGMPHLPEHKYDVLLPEHKYEVLRG